MYVRFPAIAGDILVFVSEDDLWSVPRGGGVPRRLTAGRSPVSGPRISPDGRHVAYVAAEEGNNDVYVVPTEGGDPRRLTWFAATTAVAGFLPDGRVVVTTDARSPFFRDNRLFAVPLDGGPPEALPYGLGQAIAFGPGGKVALCRHADDLARWKRYRGGRVGVIWVRDGEGAPFRRLVDTGGANQACPMWLGDRVAFLSDHDYDGNLWSCRPDGTDLVRHTNHQGFYARHAASDGRRVAYAHGADLWVWDPKDGAAQVPITAPGPRPQRRPKVVNATQGLEEWALHPQGHSLLLTVRGRPLAMGAFEGPAVAHGAPSGVRHRLATWLPDGDGVVLVSDAGGVEAIEVHTASGVRRLDGLDLGRPLELLPDPTGELVAFANHRFQVGLVSLGNGTLRWLDQSDHGRICDLAWSGDGAWLAYSKPTTPSDTAAIRIAEARTGTVRDATDGRYRDVRPSFDPEGRCLWFLSYREFDPVYDAVFFDLGFPKAVRPFALVLTAEARSPFQRDPAPPKDKDDKKDKGPVPVPIDFAGLASRLVPFPLPEGRYDRIVGAFGKVLFTTVPVEGGRRVDWNASGPPPAKATLSSYDLATGEREDLYKEVTDFAMDTKRETLAIRAGARLRVVPLGKARTGDALGRKSGWVDLARASVAIEPAAEWRQMVAEVDRLVRQHFWTEDFSGVDWGAAVARYSPLVERVATRAELSDLVWDLVGELGTSHAYEMLGDHRPAPPWRIGKLGADFAWDGGAWRIAAIVAGEPGDPERSGPLADPGVDVAVGDRLLAIDGVALSATVPPAAALVDRAGRDVLLAVQRGIHGTVRTVRVRTLSDESALRYRAWVLANRARVHEASGGTCGYVHVPDMGPLGFAEFHRDFLVECHKDGLVVDLRWNRGGHVSQLVLEKLARRPVGYGLPRWEKGPHTYPAHAVRGPMVAVTNECAGSDGDIGSHGFKRLGLGPLIGTRTWGGVVGIWPRHRLVDNTVVTQPEFCTWRDDVGYRLENHGAEPDVVVEVTPDDYAAGRDPQLDRAIAMLQERLQANPVRLPSFEPKPYLGRPK